MAQPATYVENVQSLLPATSNAEDIQQLQTTTTAISDCDTQGNVISIFGKDIPQKPQYLHDCDRLSEAALKKKYKAEHESWRSRRGSAKKEGIPFYNLWDELFSAFLRHQGPMDAAGLTLDKLIPKLGYVPGNTRWATKQEQTWNRPNTKWVIHNGQKIPLGVWADEQGINRPIAYRKYKAGWNLSEILAGKREQVTFMESTALPFNHPWPPGDETKWEAQYRQDTKGQKLDRLTYLIQESIKQLRWLDEEQEKVWFPDDYDANIEEAGRLNYLEYMYRLYSRALKHGNLRLPKPKGIMF